MTNNTNTFIFKCFRHKWTALDEVSVCSLLFAAKKPAAPVEPVGVKPFLAVYYCFGYGGQERICDLKIKDLLDRGVIRNVDNISYSSGEWHGVGSAKCAYYKDFSFKDVPAAEFFKLVDIKFNFLKSSDSEIFNSYKFIFISCCGAADLRWIYEDAYASVPGLYAALSKINLVFSIATRFRGRDCYRYTPLCFADEPDEYKDYMLAAGGHVVKLSGDNVSHCPCPDCLGKKRKREDAGKVYNFTKTL